MSQKESALHTSYRQVISATAQVFEYNRRTSAIQRLWSCAYFRRKSKDRTYICAFRCLTLFGALLWASAAPAQALGFAGTPMWYKGHNSVVRIDLIYLHDDIPVGSAWGHGVIIDPKGIVLTAAHVVFPSLAEFKEVGADSYQISIKRFNYDQGSFSQFQTVSGDHIIDKSTLTNSARTELKSCHSFYTQSYCRSKKLRLAEDFVFLDTGQSSNYFVGLVGPSDSIGLLTKTMGMQLAVASDFARFGDVRSAKVTPNPGSDYSNPSNFNTTDSFKFRGGVSGSPLYVYATEPKPAIFVSGVVVSRLVSVIAPTDDGIPDFTNFSARVIKPDIDDVAKVPLRISGRVFEWNCRQQSLPLQQSLYSYYTGFASSRQSRNILQDCGAQTKGWSHTVVALSAAATDQFKSLIGDIGNRVPFECEKVAAGETRCEQRDALLSANVDGLLDQIISISNSVAIEPMALFQAASMSIQDLDTRRTAEMLTVLVNPETEVSPESAQLNILKQRLSVSPADLDLQFAVKHNDRVKNDTFLRRLFRGDNSFQYALKDEIDAGTRRAEN